MVLAMVHKKGLWDGIWQRAVGPDLDEAAAAAAADDDDCWEDREEEDVSDS